MFCLFTVGILYADGIYNLLIIMKIRNIFSFLGVISLLFFNVHCDRVETPPNINNTVDEDVQKVYKVVAHRGGYLECNRPDCSISSLKYAIQLGCYASECDIVITKDNEIMVAHPVSGYLINGLAPYDRTVAEIRAAGKLANGEEVPTLRDFINVIKDKEQNPHGLKIWLDVKRLTKEGQDLPSDYSVDACFRACQIIKEMGAEEYCEFLIPTGSDIINAVRDKVADEYKINIAWMTCTHPGNYQQAWAQLAYTKIFGDNTSYGPMDYITAGVPLSVYNVDDDKTMDAVIPYYPKLKAIFTNYPSKLIEKLKEKGYE